MTGPRSATVQPPRTRARRLLPFLTAIILSPLACTEQSTEPQLTGAGQSPAATRLHPSLASKSGQTAPASQSAMQMSLSRSSAGQAAANLASVAGPKVLILSDVNGSSTNALANSIVSAGFHVGVVHAPEYNWFATTPSLDGYDAVIHLNGFTYNLPLTVATQGTLRDFVNNGGGFVGAQWNGYEEFAGQQTAMSELVLLGTGAAESDMCGMCDVTYSVVAGQGSHPLVAGLPSSFSFYADGHDASPKASSGAVVLMRSPSGGPAVLVREFGAGKVVNFSFAPNYADLPADRRTLEDARVQQLYVNAVRWISGAQGVPGSGTLDRDADGVVDGSDNCMNNYNPAQLDGDNDGVGDACDTDFDGDGVSDDVDNCELYNPDQLDVNENWIGDACEEVTTQPQTISFDPLADRTYGDAPFTINASASSGLPVSFVVMGECTLNGTTITITAAGSCTVIAQQGGNESWTFAENVERSFTVAKAPVTISVGTEYTFDGTPKQATVTTNPAGVSGLSVLYTLAGFPVSQPVNAGVYQVLATLENPNYQAAPAYGSLTIHPAVPVINWATPAAITFGTALGSAQLNATATGIGSSAISGTFVYLPAAGTVLQVGARPLSVELIPASGNYAHAIKTVTITVLAADVPPTRLKFKGFFQPVHNMPVLNTVAAGRAVPVRFSVEGGEGTVLKAGSPTSVPIGCSATAISRSLVETFDEPSSVLMTRGTVHTYIWKTSPTWAGNCRKLIVTLVDGSKHEAVFRFGKEQKPKAAKPLKGKHAR